MSSEFAHKSVMFEETLEGLSCKKGGIYLDCTTGGAGHSSEILRRVGEEGFIYCLDRDIEAINAARKVLDKVGNNYQLIQANYVNLDRIVEEYEIPELDGILLDLGVSSPQLDKAERGFSFSKEAPLDMRFSQDENETATAADLVNSFSKDELVKIFSEYGEEPYSKTIAEFIVQERKKKYISTTTQLSSLIVKSLDGKKFKGHIHPATRVFQALRIAVNDELKGVEKIIPKAIKSLKKGGKLVIISFHSLEDRIVKNTMREAVKECICPPRQPICNCDKTSEAKIVTKKPIIATETEIRENPRARSAKLRILEKI
ncbi:16S rRNA (cytosine(1402)-N(4))-methyltransferase RsmH [bacterium]|nr:MAG: 16S rRNA (cytosine(1402)-N(4))-methyltransferase RsmH [bacterium]